jgi:sugar/nucleoside kinase (ribokinase family)
VRLPLTLPSPNDREFDVVALGECSLDLVGVGPIGAGPSDKVSLSRFQMLPGGQAATVAVGCARLGWRSRFVGSVGDDSWADIVRDQLRREGVDPSLDVRPDAASRLALILVAESTGDRQVFEYRDARLGIAVDERLEVRACAGRLLMLDATDPAGAEAAASGARARGIPTLADVDRPGPAADRVLRHADIIVVSEGFAEAFAGSHGAGPGAGLEAIDAAFRPAVAIVTLGPEGSLARCAGREIRTPGFAVDAVDTTGAGDAFRAGFLAGWLREEASAELDTILEYANATGALNCRGLGAQSRLPSAAEVSALVTSGGRVQSN